MENYHHNENVAGTQLDIAITACTCHSLELVRDDEVWHRSAMGKLDTGIGLNQPKASPRDDPKTSLAGDAGRGRPRAIADGSRDFKSIGPREAEASLSALVAQAEAKRAITEEALIALVPARAALSKIELASGELRGDVNDKETSIKESLKREIEAWQTLVGSAEICVATFSAERQYFSAILKIAHDNEAIASRRLNQGLTRLLIKADVDDCAFLSETSNARSESTVALKSSPETQVSATEVSGEYEISLELDSNDKPPVSELASNENSSEVSSILNIDTQKIDSVGLSSQLVDDARETSSFSRISYAHSAIGVAQQQIVDARNSEPESRVDGGNDILMRISINNELWHQLVVFSVALLLILVVVASVYLSPPDGTTGEEIAVRAVRAASPFAIGGALLATLGAVLKRKGQLPW